MENFVAYNPTTLFFGEGIIGKLHETVSGIGKRVLLVYGGGSIKRNGVYNQVMEQLKLANAEVVEYSGIQSNPLVEDVDIAAALGRKYRVDAIVAVGGGSVIDSAKIISIAIPEDAPAWDYFAYTRKPKAAVPLIAVLTLAATGTEMNQFAVLSNHEAERKDGYGHRLMYPAYSFLDPAFTVSVPADYTAYGIADLVIHCFENYFSSSEEATLTDKFIFSIIREAVEYGPALMKDLQNVKLRAKIMFAATMALNGLTAMGKGGGDWGVHPVGHLLSLKYDVAHGASLSMVYPAWFRVRQQLIPERIALLGKEVFGVDGVEQTIEAFERYFTEIGSPIRVSQQVKNFDEADFLRLMKQNKATGNIFPLNGEEMEALIGYMR